MSFAGFTQFVKNLDTFMESDGFNPDDFEMAYRFFMSDYGLGNPITGKVRDLERNIEDN